MPFGFVGLTLDIYQNSTSCAIVSFFFRHFVFFLAHPECHFCIVFSSTAEAAQIVLNAPVPKTMIPLNVTHQAIVTDSIHARLTNSTPHGASSEVASSQLRHTLSTLISFFKESYKNAFSFIDGPPLHDALTIAYVSQPELFTTRRYRVDVELTGTHSSGQTVADVWGYSKVDDTWGRTGKNCEVAEDLDVCTVSRFCLCMLTGALARSRHFSSFFLIAWRDATGYRH